MIFSSSSLSRDDDGGNGTNFTRLLFRDEVEVFARVGVNAEADAIDLCGELVADEGVLGWTTLWTTALFSRFIIRLDLASAVREVLRLDALPLSERDVRLVFRDMCCFFFVFLLL